MLTLKSIELLYYCAHKYNTIHYIVYLDIAKHLSKTLTGDTTLADFRQWH